MATPQMPGGVRKLAGGGAEAIDRGTRPFGRSRVMLDLFEIFMMRKCMLGIKRRAEATIP
jgi:hypothetical protein